LSTVSWIAQQQTIIYGSKIIGKCMAAYIQACISMLYLVLHIDYTVVRCISFIIKGCLPVASLGTCDTWEQFYRLVTCADDQLYLQSYMHLLHKAITWLQYYVCSSWHSVLPYTTAWYSGDRKSLSLAFTSAPDSISSIIMCLAGSLKKKH